MRSHAATTQQLYRCILVMLVCSLSILCCGTTKLTPHTGDKCCLFDNILGSTEAIQESVSPALTPPVNSGSQQSTIANDSFENFSLNTAVFRSINNRHSLLSDIFFSCFWYLGSWYVLIPVLLFLWYVRPRKLKYVILAVAIQGLFVAVIQNSWDQPRPAILLDGVRLLQPLYEHSFPAGDVAFAFAIACCLCAGESRRRRVALIGYALLIAIERIYVGVHFPLDVCAGALVGCAASLIAYRILESTTGQQMQQALLKWHAFLRFWQSFLGEGIPMRNSVPRI